MHKREPGIDLFRCLGLLFVTGLHGFLYNGFYGEIQGEELVWIATSFRWLFSGCNGMFMLLTGYLKTTKPLNRQYYRGLLTVLTGYTLTCLISYPIRYFLFGERDGLALWINRFFTFDGYGWYIGMYIGLILFSPIINLALGQMADRRGLLGIAGTMLVLTALPSLTPLHVLPEYWTALYPLTYYTIGAVIRRLDPALPSGYCLLGSIGTACFMGLLSALTARGGVFTDGFPQGGNGGFLTTVMVTFLFLGIYRLPLHRVFSKVLAWLSGGVFEGYLLSRLLDVWVYGCFPGLHSPEFYPILFLCATVPIFCISLLSGKAVHSLAEKIANR